MEHIPLSSKRKKKSREDCVESDKTEGQRVFDNGNGEHDPVSQTEGRTELDNSAFRRKVLDNGKEKSGNIIY